MHIKANKLPAKAARIKRRTAKAVPKAAAGAKGKLKKSPLVRWAKAQVLKAGALTVLKAIKKKLFKKK